MSLLSKKDHEMVIEALETLIQKKEETDDKFQYLNLLNWVKLKSKEHFWFLFPCSSVVERRSVKPLVPGPNPGGGVGNIAKSNPSVWL